MSLLNNYNTNSDRLGLFLCVLLLKATSTIPNTNSNTVIVTAATKFNRNP